MSKDIQIKTQEYLKILSSYLPYKLQTNYGELIGIRNWVGWCGVFKDNTIGVNIPLLQIKPILKPFEEYKNIEEILDEITDLERFHLEDNPNYLEYISFSAVEKMFENHIDVFGLLPLNLAIKNEN